MTPTEILEMLNRPRTENGPDLWEEIISLQDFDEHVTNVIDSQHTCQAFATTDKEYFMDPTSGEWYCDEEYVTSYMRAFAQATAENVWQAGVKNGNEQLKALSQNISICVTAESFGAEYGYTKEAVELSQEVLRSLFREGTSATVGMLNLVPMLQEQGRWMEKASPLDMD